MLRNTLIAAAAFGFALAAGPTFADDNGGGGKPGATEQTQANKNDQSSNVDTNCADILANPNGHPAADVERCKAKK